MRIIALAAAAALTGLAVAGCGGSPHHAAAAAHSSAAPAASSVSPAPMSTDPNGQTCYSQVMDSNGYCPGDSPSPAPSDSLNGSIGTSFTVTADDGTSYDVTLDAVKQHVRLGQYDSLNNYQDHVAAAQFTIKGDTGSSSDDAFSDANAIGSDQTEYQSTFVVESLPEFSSGEFQVAPGQTEKGWVTFELPPGVTIAQVQWAPGGGKAATWTVGT